MGAKTNRERRAAHYYAGDDEERLDTPAKLVFKSTRKTGDYHGQMNHKLFSKWFSEQLLANMPKNSLIIMDNAPYHNILSLHSAPTASCKKAEIRAWLIKNRIPVREGLSQS